MLYPGTTGSTLGMKQIEGLLVAARCPADWLLTLAAIPWFESSGVTNELNNYPPTGDYSIGLWQINYYGYLFPAREAAYGPPNKLAGDPEAQARAAVDILGGGAGISAWYGDPIGTAAQAGPLTAAQIEAIFIQHAVPTDWYTGGGPVPGPPPAPAPTPKEKDMQVTFGPDGTRWIAASSTANHLLVFSAPSGADDYSVIDVTDEIEKAHPGTGPYLVQP